MLESVKGRLNELIWWMVEWKDGQTDEATQGKSIMSTKRTHVVNFKYKYGNGYDYVRI